MRIIESAIYENSEPDFLDFMNTLENLCDKVEIDKLRKIWTDMKQKIDTLKTP